VRTIDIAEEEMQSGEALYSLGIRSAKDLEGKDPVAMYEQLRSTPGSYAEPCLLNQLKIAVKAAGSVKE